MKKRKKRICFLIVVMITLMITIPAFTNAQDSEEVSVLGMVTDDGLLVTEDGEEYVIDQDVEEGKDLLQMSGKKVVVNGVVSEDDGTFTILVSSFGEAE